MNRIIGTFARGSKADVPVKRETQHFALIICNFCLPCPQKISPRNNVLFANCGVNTCNDDIIFIKLVFTGATTFTMVCYF